MIYGNTLTLAYVMITCACLVFAVPCLYAQEPTSAWDIGRCDREKVASDEAVAVGADSQRTGKSRTVGSVIVERKPIFDESIPEENNWLFRLVNRLHKPTRTHVITDDLLFKEGDALDLKALESSERILNTRRYFGLGTVSLVDPCQEPAEVKVSVREVWTLVPTLDFSRSGGQNKSSIGIEDSNFFGSGKTVSIKRTSEDGKTGDIYQYKDPNIGAYNSFLQLGFRNNDDGKEVQASLIRPFVDFSTQWAAGLDYHDFTEDESLYNAGDEAQRFIHEGHDISVFFGRKIDWHLFDDTPDATSRILVGFDNGDHDFSVQPKGAALPNSTAPLPEERVFSTLWFEYQYIEDGFIKTLNLQQINRPEYVNVGHQIILRAGVSPTSVRNVSGQEETAYLFDATYARGTGWHDSRFLLSSIRVNGYVGAEGLFSTRADAALQFHWQNMERGQLYLYLNGKKGYELFRDEPIVLGGETGLRGYPKFYQAGDRSVLYTMEQRFFGKKEWFSLFHLGSAVFYDVGRAWGEAAISQSETGWLQDVGVGLRLSGTRNGNQAEGGHTILHVDFVKPLNGRPEDRDYQWRLKAESHF